MAVALAGVNLRDKEIERLIFGYRPFQLTYRNDPRGFVEDCIDFPVGERPSAYQLDCLDTIAGADRVAIRAPRGSGKTALAAWLVHWFALTRDERTDWKIVLTASNHRQLERYLLPEVWKWAHLLNWKKIGRERYDAGEELQLRLLRLKTGEAAPIASNNPDSMEGAHASELLVIFDEAKIIPDVTWDAMSGAFASAGAGKWLAISTPGAPAGRFYDIHRHARGFEHWATRHISLTEATAAGRVSPEWADELKASLGEQSSAYKTYALAEFASDLGNNLIPLSWVEDAQARWAEYDASGWARRNDGGRPLACTSIAFDVGGGQAGGDASTIAIVRDRFLVEKIIKIPVAPDPSQATMHLAGIVKGLYEQHRPRYLIGDAIGIGAGVVHRLREEGIPCLAFIAGAATSLMDAAGISGFDSWRSAGWHGLKELMDPQSGVRVCLPPDDDLTADLVSVGDGGLTSSGKHRAESKPEIRKRLGRSTDCGDCVMMSLVGPALFEQLARDSGQRGHLVYDPVIVESWR